jgi:microsomal dipeptidase-like Zn-dependent dipeptidase
MKKAFLILAWILFFVLGLFFFVVPSLADKFLNRVVNHQPSPVSETAKQLHEKLLIADLHADCLLWNRDLLERGSRGHVDLPRLLEGNVALQAFTVVTKMPLIPSLESNDDDTDSITLLALAQRWPSSTWRSLKERALYQANKLHQFAAQSGGKLIVIKSANDLSAFLERRRQEREIIGGFLGIEGAHALDGDLANLNVLFDAGFRMMAPTHFFDNDIGGSAHGLSKGGLSEQGREMIKRMEAKRMIVDLAHASPKVMDEILSIAARPVVVSHTGVKGTCNNNRNLSDEQLKVIAATGGVIGIGYWDYAVCGHDAKAIACAIRHVANLVGVEHVGLGSDFDGAVAQPFDASGLVQLTDALLTDGFSESDVEKIMGGNVLRLLLENLP